MESLPPPTRSSVNSCVSIWQVTPVMSLSWTSQATCVDLWDSSLCLCPVWWVGTTLCAATCRVFSGHLWCLLLTRAMLGQSPTPTTTDHSLHRRDHPSYVCLPVVVGVLRDPVCVLAPPQIDPQVPATPVRQVCLEEQKLTELEFGSSCCQCSDPSQQLVLSMWLLQ